MYKDVLIAPSILNCDFLHLAAELDKISNADWVHYDVMDNHFVPNLSFGLPVVEQIIQHTNIPVDAHLMIANPDKWAPSYAEAGCSSVTFHLEAAQRVESLIADIRKHGAQVCAAIKPNTSWEAVVPYLNNLDMVLIMTVEPGFGGQSFMHPMLKKVQELRKIISAQNLSLKLQVDGGVSAKTIELAAASGADVFVAGSAVYRADDAAACIDEIRQLAQDSFCQC